MNQNADLSELKKFNAASGHWWDLDGEFSALHKLNPLRCDYIDSYAQVEGKRLMDIGCGGGILAEELAARGCNVTGLDLGDGAIRAARSHAEHMQLEIDYELLSAEDAASQCLDKTRDRYDIVTCMEMLEHVPDPSSVVRACANLCKPGGSLFFATISRTLKAYLLMVVGAEYILQMVPRGTHDYQKFIRPSELSGWIRASGLTVTDGTGVTYNPVKQNFRLAPNDLDVNYMLRVHKPS